MIESRDHVTNHGIIRARAPHRSRAGNYTVRDCSVVGKRTRIRLNVYAITAVQNVYKIKPGIQRVQALADVSRSALCCHSNETCAPTANLPNNGQPEGTLYLPFPRLHLGPCSSVGMRRGTDKHTDGRGQYTSRLGYASREM